MNLTNVWQVAKSKRYIAALAGGTEESVSPICIAGFGNLGALSTEDDPHRASHARSDVVDDLYVPHSLQFLPCCLPVGCTR